VGISKWNAGIIRPVPVAPTGSYSTDSAPGVWTLDQQAYWQKQGVWPTAGNINPNLFIENLFQTYLYNGNSSTQTITNGINFSANGGMLWLKGRRPDIGSGTMGNYLFDTIRGVNSRLSSEYTSGATLNDDDLTSFNTNGFTLNTVAQRANRSGVSYVSWSFREQAKFFDVVSYTGTGSNTTIAHNLGAVPGCIIVKRTDTAAAWAVYHRSLANTQYLVLNTTASAATGATWWNSTTPTSAVFSVGTDASVNASGGTYVAYIFAHDAGGFGTSGTDNVVSCGSFNTNGSGSATVSLGYEPQFVMWKLASGGTEDWYIMDSARGLPALGFYRVYPNLGEATEGISNTVPWCGATSTGFTVANESGSSTYIYVTVRRGPMQVPTLGTTVFDPVARTGTGSAVTVSNSLVSTDATLTLNRGGGTYNPFVNKLIGTGYYLTPVDTIAEVTQTETVQFDATNAVKWPASSAFGGSGNFSGNNYINYFFRRAPSFFDSVVYSGNSVAGRTVTHNLGAVPQLMIVKCRTTGAGPAWVTYAEAAGNTQYSELDSTARFTAVGDYWNNTSPTSSVFSLASNTSVNRTGDSYVAYLFATCPGVSKVGSYAGTGALQTVACGFTSGARFVLIKRIDVNAAWYVWDSARGITSGNDPYLLVNSTAAEVTSTNYVDTDSTGFQVTAAAPAGINASGGTYLFLAIA
jgi:hypothetical protein